MLMCNFCMLQQFLHGETQFSMLRPTIFAYRVTGTSSQREITLLVQRLKKNESLAIFANHYSSVCF